MHLLAPIGISLTPVFVFLGALMFLDTYKLIRPKRVLIAIGYGGLAAGFCYFANGFLYQQLGWSQEAFTHYVSPFVEEFTKALLIVFLMARHKIGFSVDAAIAGFSVGAGFAAVENVYYLSQLGDVGLITWFVRGFGTAVMHGGTTALLGILTMHASDRRELPLWIAALIGLGAAYVFHSGFNHFPLRPVPMTLLQLAVLPTVVVIVFQRSEQYTQEWLGVGFDSDQELLAIIYDGRISESRIGAYLEELKAQFPGEVVVDMLCYLRLYIELSMKAKGTLLMQQAGFKVAPDPTIRPKFEELEYLKNSIGRLGLLALAPFIHTSSRDLWQIHFVK
ncbi:MAG TPA: PrsW family glutamic-type intramembrane protease [Rhodothermales bacterium]